MLQEQFDIIGYRDNYIYFRLKGRIICIKTKLPREEMIIKLGVEPEDVKALRDEIQLEVSSKMLTHEEHLNLMKELYKQEKEDIYEKH